MHIFFLHRQNIAAIITSLQTPSLCTNIVPNKSSVLPNADTLGDIEINCNCSEFCHILTFRSDYLSNKTPPSVHVLPIRYFTSVCTICVGKGGAKRTPEL